jgi:hypothetical protein
MWRELLQFGTAGWVGAWHPVDDAVMEGLATSCLRHDPGGHTGSAAAIGTIAGISRGVVRRARPS